MEAILSLSPSIITNVASFKPFTSYSSSLPSSLHHSSLSFSSWKQQRRSQSQRQRQSGVFTVLTMVDEKRSVVSGENYVGVESDDDEVLSSKEGRPCELYVCNLPRRCDSTQLHDMFFPFGTVLSAQVDCNDETGESRGCGYVTMGSLNSAKKALSALDRSDLDGREVRVRFSAEMNAGRRNVETMNSTPQKVIYYETPYKLYVGNLARAVKPEDLWNQFQRFGTVVSVRILRDHKEGKGRIYAFLSFLSQSERDAAMSLNGTELRGRTLVVREGVDRYVP